MPRTLYVVMVLAAGCGSAQPKGVPGDKAESLARSMLKAVKADAWSETGAVTWVFRGSNRHLWDRRRGFAQVVWDDKKAIFSVDRRLGVAFEKESHLSTDKAKEALDDAHAKWTNDAFWLNPVVKAFDPGTERKWVEPKNGQPGLLVEYTSGGRTPGDAYLWRLNEAGRPVSWQMWTSNIPVGGLEASWEGWVELKSGALVSTKHELSLLTLELTEVKGDVVLSKLVSGDDPFSALEKCLAEGSCVSF